MRQADFAALLLAATSGSAMPAIIGQNPFSAPQLSDDGLVALPSGAITTGELQPLPEQQQENNIIAGQEQQTGGADSAVDIIGNGNVLPPQPSDDGLVALPSGPITTGELQPLPKQQGNNIIPGQDQQAGGADSAVDIINDGNVLPPQPSDDGLVALPSGPITSGELQPLPEQQQENTIIAGEEQQAGGQDAAADVIENGNGNVLPPQPQADGLVALPAGPITTGELQPLPGAGTGPATEVIQSPSALPVQTTSSSSAVLGEIIPSETVIPTTSTSLPVLIPSAGSEVIAGPSSTVADLSSVDGLSSTTAAASMPPLETIGVGASAIASTGVEPPSSIATDVSPTLEPLPTATPPVSSASATLGGFQTIVTGAASPTSLATTSELSEATSAVLTSELSAPSSALLTPLPLAPSPTISTGPEAESSAVVLEPLPSGSGGLASSASLVDLPAISSSPFATTTSAAESLSSSDAALESSSDPLGQLPGAGITASETSLQALPTASGSSDSLSTARGSGLTSTSASTTEIVASQTGGLFASASGDAVLSDNTNSTTIVGQNAAARDLGSVLLVSLVAGAVGLAGLFVL